VYCHDKFGFRLVKFLEEDVRHLRVIVLPGMDHNLPVVFSKFSGYRGTFDELEPGIDD